MPYVSLHVDLDDFDESDLIEELESRGYQCVKTGGAQLADLSDDGLGRIDHLASLGLREQARAEALELCGKAIGRPL